MKYGEIVSLSRDKKPTNPSMAGNACFQFTIYCFFKKDFENCQVKKNSLQSLLNFQLRNSEMGSK